MEGGGEQQLSVCVLCTQRFATSTGPELNNCISGKFVVFAKHHLEIAITEDFLRDTETLFCKKCHDFVSIVCSLYDELCGIREKLAAKLEQLADLVEGVDDQLADEDGSIMKGIEYEKVEEMRRRLFEKCKIHSRPSLPPVSKENECLRPRGPSGSTFANDDVLDDLDVKVETESLNENRVADDAVVKEERNLGGDEDDNHIIDNQIGNPPCSPPDTFGSSGDREQTDSDSDWNAADSDKEQSDTADNSTASSCSDWEQTPKRIKIKLVKLSSAKEEPKKNVDPEKSHPFNCDLCGKTFTTKGAVVLHKKNIHKIHPPPSDRPFSCEKCGSKVKTKNYLQNHMKRAHGIGIAAKGNDKPYKCEICGKGSANQYNRLRHMQTMHGIDDKTKQKKPKPYNCEICGKGFPSEYNRLRHMKTMHEIDKTKPKKPKPYKCEICGKGFPSEYNRLRHIKTMHGIDKTRQQKQPKPHKCTQCSKDFDKLFYLERHLNLKHKQKLSFKCLQCSAAFDTRRLRAHHHYEIHKKDIKSLSFMKRVTSAKGNSNDTVDEACVVCGMEFKSWDLLGKHLKQHEKKLTDKDKSEKCYFCSESFTHQQTIWAHLRSSQSHNFTKVEFPCDHENHMGLTQWIYPNPDKLEEHLKQEHEDCPISKCGECGWSFLNKNMLDLHRLLHLPRMKSKHQCPSCEKFFLTADTMQDHYNMVHGVNLKLYRCSVCLCGFSTKIGCTNHERIHKTAAPHASVESGAGSAGGPRNLFSCVECSKTYPTAIQLRDHKRSLHISKQCEQCGLLVQRSKMGYHMRTVHDKDKGRHMCSLCGKTYSLAILLRQHMGQHGQHPFTCQFCGSGSRSGGHLRRHIGRMHKDKLVNQPELV